MEEKYLVRNSSSIPSPALLFYEKEIAANIRKALDIAGDPARLRPHVKTHKTREIVAMKMRLGISKFKCATIAEAEMVAQTGAKDVMLAYPVIGPNIERFITLIQKYPSTTFEATVDNEAMAEKLSDAALARSSRVEVLIDIDPGLHRTGVTIGEAATNLYKKISSLKGLERPPARRHPLLRRPQSPARSGRTEPCGHGLLRRGHGLPGSAHRGQAPRAAGRHGWNPDLPRLRALSRGRALARHLFFTRLELSFQFSGSGLQPRSPPARPGDQRQQQVLDLHPGSRLQGHLGRPPGDPRGHP